MDESQPITVVCPACGLAYEVEASMAGRRARCEGCGHKFNLDRQTQVPSASAPRVEPTKVAAAERLWEDSVAPDAGQDLSIKPPPGPATASFSRPVIRPRRIGPPPTGQPEASGDNDFEILETLGRGGMGVVYRARQASVDRSVALKTMRPEQAAERTARANFLAEAVVTGDLEHPNVVPVYDLGADAEGNLFYAMKEVKGTSWKDVLRQRSLDDNLDVLLRVCDAVAFAHDRGVVHRDLKPENVMLGEYGEVMVMDWGLAAAGYGTSKAQPLASTSGCAGTPTYMAPEMAAGATEVIGPASDVYLLGGILYEIVTGLRPHHGANVHACLRAALQNEIQPTDKTGELVETARRAMATLPADRYPNVKAFQDAIRSCRRHQESTRLAERASEQLARARESGRYEDYAGAVFKFRDALDLWPDNPQAGAGVPNASLAYAQCAFAKGDLDLALSLLETDREEHRDLRLKAETARRARAARQKRLQALTWTSVGLAVAVIVALSVGFLLVQAQRERARRAEHEARAAETTARTAQAAETQRREELERESYLSLIATADSAIVASRFAKAEAALWSTDPRRRHWEWGYLMRRCRPELLTLADQSRNVIAAAFSGDGAKAVTGGADGTVTVWDLATASALTSVQGHTAQLRDIACSPDGRLAVSGGADGAVQLWELATGKVQATLGRLESPVLSVAFTADGARVAASDCKGWVMVWDCRTRQCVRKIELLFGDKQRTGRHFVHDIAFAPDSRRLATAGEDGRARIWDTQTGAMLRSIPIGAHEETMAVAFSVDGKTLLTGSFKDGWVATWDAETGRNLSGTPAHAGPLTAVNSSPDGATFLSGSWDRTVRLWTARDVTPRSVIAGAGAEVTAASFSPDGSLVLTAAGAVRVWASAGEPSNVLDGALWSMGVDITPDGRRVVAYNGYSGGGVWEVSSRRLERKLNRKGIRAVAVAPDGATLATADATGISIEYLQSGQERVRFKLAQGAGDCLAFSPDGVLIATGGRFRSGVQLLDASTGGERLVLADAIGPIAFAGDGARLVTGGDKDGARVWDTRSGGALCTLSHQATMAIAFSPDGRLVMGCGTHPVQGAEPTREERSIEGNLVRLWDATTGREVRTLSGHTQVVSSVAFFPDSRRAVTGGADMLLRVWDVDTGRELLQLQGHTHHVTGVAVSRDGRTIASASFDYTARVWEAWDWSMTPAQVADLKLAQFREFRAAHAAPRPR